MIYSIATQLPRQLGAVALMYTAPFVARAEGLFLTAWARVRRRAGRFRCHIRMAGIVTKDGRPSYLYSDGTILPVMAGGAVTDAEMTSSTEGAFLPEVWSQKTADAAQFKAMVTETVDKSLEDEVQMGRIVHRPHRSNLTTQSKTEGVSNTVVFEAIDLVAYQVAA